MAKPFALSLKGRDWNYLFTEMVIVLFGVFLGMEFSNWNEKRRETAEIERLLGQLKDELAYQARGDVKLDAYYDVTDRYGAVALAGWANDPAVSDREFVIAAMQASQITGISYDTMNWGQIFGSSLIRSIDDDPLREAMVRMLTADQTGQEWTILRTDYRRSVRGIIPFDIQTRIHDDCGDISDEDQFISLPEACDIDIDPDRAASIAAKLRARPDLVEKLQWHLDDTRNYRVNNAGFAAGRNDVLEALEAHGI